MLAVIVEKKVKDICEYLGVDSCSELSLLTESLLEYQVKELKSIGVSEFICFGAETSVDMEAMVHLNDFSGFLDYIEKSRCKSLVLVPSNVFFEFKNCVNKLNLLDLSSVSFVDESGEKCCALFNKSYFIDIIKNKDKSYLCSSDFLCDANTEINCADKVFTVENIKDYKPLINIILDSQTNISLPTVAGGVFASGQMPKGDFVIVPPVFFGENVQIESDCVIGPYTVISDNTLISGNSYVKSSILLNDCFVSSSCFIDNVICGENVSVRRDSAVFGGTVLGKNVTVAESTFIENDSYIRPFTNVSEYKNKSVNYKINESCSGFCGYSPEKAALLGGAIGSVYRGAKIGIMCNDEINAQILKYAVVSGLMSTGVKCFDFGYGFLSCLPFYVNYCELDYGIFINGTQDGTMISVVKRNSLVLSKDDFYSIKERMLKADIKRCEKEECENVHQIKGMRQIYVQNLIKNIKNELNILPVFSFSDKYIENVIQSAFSRIKYTDFKDTIFFKINENGTVCECTVNGKKYSHTRLCDFVSFFSTEQSLLDLKFWRNDAVCLCFKVLEIIGEFNLDFTTEIENIPSFYVAEKVIETDKKIPFIASRLSDNMKVSFRHNELCLEDRDLRFKIMENGKHNKIKVLARSYKEEFAREIVLDAEKLLMNIDI